MEKNTIKNTNTANNKCKNNCKHQALPKEVHDVYRCIGSMNDIDRLYAAAEALMVSTKEQLDAIQNISDGKPEMYHLHSNNAKLFNQIGMMILKVPCKG